MALNPKMAGNIIQTLAELPDFLRKPILKNRLDEFYSMPYQDRYETIMMALSAANTIDQKKLAVLVRTWLDVLSSFDGNKVFAIFETYCNVISINPMLLERLDIDLLSEAYMSLDQVKKEKLNDVLKEVIFNTPDKRAIIQAIPQKARDMLAIN